MIEYNGGCIVTYLPIQHYYNVSISYVQRNLTLFQPCLGPLVGGWIIEVTGLQDSYAFIVDELINPWVHALPIGYNSKMAAIQMLEIARFHCTHTVYLCSETESINLCMLISFGCNSDDWIARFHTCTCMSVQGILIVTWSCYL